MGLLIFGFYVVMDNSMFLSTEPIFMYYIPLTVLDTWVKSLYLEPNSQVQIYTFFFRSEIQHPFLEFLT